MLWQGHEGADLFRKRYFQHFNVQGTVSGGGIRKMEVNRCPGRNDTCGYKQSRAAVRVGGRGGLLRGRTLEKQAAVTGEDV